MNAQELQQNKLALTIRPLLDLLAEKGGEIVSTASLNQSSIDQARASGRMYVDENGLGFVWMPDIHLLPTNDAELAEFEKWFPLDVPLPEHLKTPEFMERIVKAPQTQVTLSTSIPQ